MQDALDERARRLWAATEARAAGRGGFTAVLQATGMSSRTLARGLCELDSSDKLPPNRVRRPGAGRKAAKTLDPGLVVALEELVEPATRGDPESPLRWTCKSLRRLSEELRARGYQASRTLVGQLLHEAGYSLQANRKTHEGAHHPDRNARFEHLSRRVKGQLKRHAPVISVDTKKKELVGDFKNGGQEWRPKGDPEKVRVHDFLDREKGKAIPYGVYDVGANRGWVSVGVTHDTAAFAVHTIRRWRRNMGRRTYARAGSLLITADGGGSHGVRVRLWKWEFQKLADETGLTVPVCHLPPGTSKWNKIEHRMFSFISKNRRGKPLFTHATIVNLISKTRTQQGLTVRCVLHRKKYPNKIKVTDEQMQTLRLTPDRFHGIGITPFDQDSNSLRYFLTNA